MRTIVIAGLGLLALGGCGPSTRDSVAVPVDNAAEANAVDDNGTVAAVLGMTDKMRDVVLVRAIMDAGMHCDGVTKSERQADQEGQPAWLAQCANGTSHMVIFNADGTAKVLSHSGAPHD